MERGNYPFNPEDTEKKGEVIKQFHEDKERVPEVLHGRSALEKYTPREEREKQKDNVEEEVEDMQEDLKAKLAEELENDPNKKIEWMKSKLSKEEYINQQLGIKQ